jgi:putative hemolysin
MGERLLFSYASADDPALRRIAIRTIERLTGQPRLKRMYLANQRHPRVGETFWDAAVRQLELQIDYDETRLRAIPAVGPVVVVANHPFGVLDGIVIGYLVGKVRPDFKVLTHSLLCRVAELQPYLLPIDFGETAAATATNLRSRAEALSWLRNNGGALVVFPGGAVSTSERLFGRRAIDPEWKLFTAKAITRAQATVVPIFFEGQNSRLFQVASHISLTLRLSLLLNEVRNKIGSVVAVRIGAPVAYAELSHIADRKALAEYLRRATYELAAGDGPGKSRSAPIARGRRSALLRTTRRRLAERLRRGKRSYRGRA